MNMIYEHKDYNRFMNIDCVHNGVLNDKSMNIDCVHKIVNIDYEHRLSMNIDCVHKLWMILIFRISGFVEKSMCACTLCVFIDFLYKTLS